MHNNISIHRTYARQDYILLVTINTYARHVKNLLMALAILFRKTRIKRNNIQYPLKRTRIVSNAFYYFDVYFIMYARYVRLRSLQCVVEVLLSF